MKPTPEIVLGVCASIAAYKSVTVARELQKAGRTVRVVMTPRAQRFIGASTFAALTGSQPYADLFQEAEGELHVQFSTLAERMLVAPATADCLARLAQGRADDPVAATALCFDGPLFVAPAMHPRMWEHPATRHNCQLLKNRGVKFLGPCVGPVASGEVGMGRMLEPEEIVQQLFAGDTPQDLRGLRVVITAGPTVEDIDAVRFISNRSSGKMGYALAARASARGATVDLISGPVELPAPPGVTRHSVRSALDMQAVLQSQYSQGTDVVIMSAAVGDYRMAESTTTKLKRSGDLTLNLVQNPDLIAALGHLRQGPTPLLVAFAVETGTDDQVLSYARDKLRKKKVDLVVANHAAEAFGRDDNRVHLVEEHGANSLERQEKERVADRILDWVREHRVTV